MRVRRTGDKMTTDLPRRKNIRLKGYDYSQSGAYFITLCVKDRYNLLWENDVDVGTRIVRHHDIIQYPQLSNTGKVVDIAVNNIHEKYPTILVDKYVIMPNHIHTILVLQGEDERIINSGRPMAAPTISTVINQMKGYVTKQIGFSIWQKLFHDHIIRNEAEYQKIWEYIDTNPLKWQNDCYYDKNNG